MPLEVFYSYAHDDEKLRDELEKALSVLRRNGLIVGWHDRRIAAGDSLKAEIDAHVRSAHIILLLISNDFLASDYCYGVEMKVALERHARHEAIVIPIILRPADWSGAPFGDLKALPRDAKAVTSWPNQDEAFADIARGIREVVQRFQPSASAATSPGMPVGGLKDRHVPKSRVLDAALPSHVIKDRATELLVLIRLPESPGLAGALLVDEDAEAKPEDVRSKAFNVVFPLGLDGRPDPLKITVRLTSPDFSPGVQGKNLFVPPEEDSELLRFLLTPVRTGKLKVLVELQWEDALRGSRSLKTECVAEARSVPTDSGMNVVHMELNASVGGARERGGFTETCGSAGEPSNSPEIASAGLSDYTRGADGSLVLPSSPKPPAPAATGPRPKSEYTRVLEPTRTIPRGSDTAEEYNHTRYHERAESPASYRSPPPVLRSVKSSTTAILVAVLGAISAITVGYWQYGSKTQGSATDASHQDVVLRWHVINAQTKEFVPDARVTVVLDSGNAPVEKFTDSAGNTSVNLSEVKPNAHGRLYVHAEGYQPLQKDFVVADSMANEEVRLDPLKSTTPPPKLGASIIAGRVVDSSTNAGLSHASISPAGRTETYLTDDNGNFRIRLIAPFSNEGVRLQVKKFGCATLDQVVRPATESLTLELNCSHKIS